MDSNLPATGAPEDLDAPDAGAWGEWNPTEDSVRPVRGRHRVVRQRGGLARSSTVLGVGVIAAVGAGGIATAQDRPQVAISIPSLPTSIPGLGSTEQPEEDPAGAAYAVSVSAPFTTAGVSPQQAEAGTNAGEVLRNRILQQAEAQSDAAAAEAKEAAARAAEVAAAQEAARARETARKAAEAAAEAAAKAAAEAKAEAAARAAEAERAARAERDRAAEGDSGTGSGSSRGGYVLPTSSYTLTSHYGDSGSMWSSGHHTGLDFAAPTGTPVKAVHGGTVVSAGWSGAYGYRIVLRLADGTEIWYCHLSSMSVTSGQVGTGDTIGRVGATGNVTGAHLHLEVRTGGQTQDPLAWLRDKGLTV